MELTEKILKELEKYKFSTFVVGVKSKDSDKKREIKKLLKQKISEKYNAKYDFKNPEIEVIVNLDEEFFEIKPRPLYIYGKYNKYVKIPQTKWPCRVCKGKGCKRCNYKGKMYEESVEELIAKPLLDVTQGEGTRFHGAGREDIDVLCYGWREFVIEVLKPKKRNIDLKELERKINEYAKNKIEVKDLKIVEKLWVRKIKESRKNKIYRVFVKVENLGNVKEKLKDIEKTFKDIIIEQRTPKRVLHRRSDKLRRRKVFWVKLVKVNEKNCEITLDIKAEAGTYIKEFVTGDNGRTKPSIQEFLGTKLEVKEMWVIGFV